jgi:UDP-glucuronate 4-epimerase
MVSILSEELNTVPVLQKLPMQAGDVQKTNADILKAKTLIGYQPKTNFQNGIKIFVEWFLRKKTKK